MANSRTDVIVFSPYFPPAFLGGGPIRTLSALTLAAPPPFQPFIVTSDTDLGQKAPLPVLRNKWSEYGGLPVYYFSTDSIFKTLKVLVEVHQLCPAIVYLSSFFNFRFSIVPQLLIWMGYYKPGYTVLAPRGEFSDGALALKSSKKKLYLRLYRMSGLAKRTVWHASSEREAVDIRRAVGDAAKIIVRENDTDLPNTAVDGSAPSSPHLRAVFVGRIVKIKGLLILLQGLRACRAELHLDIYGPEEDKAYASECREVAKLLPANVRANFLGPLPNEQMRNALRQYDVMLFPTFGENFGHVIPEALSASCPVICADVTPWTQRLLGGGGGIVDENTPECWRQAVEDYATLEQNERTRARRAAGRCFNEWRAGLSAPHIFELLTPE